jgi:hypothetical protein
MEPDEAANRLVESNSAKLRAITFFIKFTLFFPPWVSRRDSVGAARLYLMLTTLRKTLAFFHLRLTIAGAGFNQTATYRKVRNRRR